MSTSGQAVQTVRTANQFQLQNESGNTVVTYYPQAPGPIVAGEPTGPLLEYSGPEGKHNFRGAKEVEVQHLTQLGQMVSVLLNRSVAFVLCLPPVAMGETNSQEITTFCVKAKFQGGSTGARLAYETETIKGKANFIMMPC